MHIFRLAEEQELLLTPFKRNVEVWRQLWGVLERSHLIMQIVDAQNPLRFGCKDLGYMYQISRVVLGRQLIEEKILLINKADLLT